jgi:tetratricopeptide (TPR) repeat protein
LLAERQPESRDFVRRFMLGMAEQSQRDFCLKDALRWSERGLELFPGDAELLQTAGGVYEEAATVPSAARVLAKMVVAARSERALRSMPAKRAWAFGKARRFFADAVRSDEGLVLARLRLGRVSWRLGDNDGARAALEAAIARSTDASDLYLGRLFLGRVHEDAGRLDAALREYARAVAHDPQGQAAAVALAHAQVLAGDAAGARRTLNGVLPHAGRRAARDFYWDYLAIDPASAEARFDRLRREASE